MHLHHKLHLKQDLVSKMLSYKNFTKEQKFKEEWEAARQRTQEFKNELMQVLNL